MIRKFMDLSLTHLTPATRKWLERQAEEPEEQITLIASHRYGWWLWAGTDDEPDDDETPADLSACRRYARANGCDYVNFDCDYSPMSEELQALPSFEEPVP